MDKKERELIFEKIIRLKGTEQTQEVKLEIQKLQQKLDNND